MFLAKKATFIIIRRVNIHYTIKKYKQSKSITGHTSVRRHLPLEVIVINCQIHLSTSSATVSYSMEERTRGPWFVHWVAIAATGSEQPRAIVHWQGFPLRSLMALAMHAHTSHQPVLSRFSVSEVIV